MIRNAAHDLLPRMQNETLAGLNPQIIASLETTLADGWKSVAAEQPTDQPKRRRAPSKRKPKA